MKTDANIEIIKKYMKTTKIKIGFGGIVFIFLIILYLFAYSNIASPIVYNFLMIVSLYIIINNLIIYLNLKKVSKFLITNNLINRIGNIEFWNGTNYIMTENYMIILHKRKVECFKYSDIAKIIKESNYKLYHRYSYNEYVHIILKNNKKFKVLSFSLKRPIYKQRDIGEYLTMKNNTIVVSEKTSVIPFK